MKRSGYDLCLMLESTVTLNANEDREPEAAPEPLISGEVHLTAEDLEFLQELSIAA
jgi:hypothetical protein